MKLTSGCSPCSLFDVPITPPRPCVRVPSSKSTPPSRLSPFQYIFYHAPDVRDLAHVVFRSCRQSDVPNMPCGMLSHNHRTFRQILPQTSRRWPPGKVAFWPKTSSISGRLVLAIGACPRSTSPCVKTTQPWPPDRPLTSSVSS
ncbi:hypothetical protein C2E23DRAFT_523304 [Lenzites betulinus]|nr:hypothetical protein C2E23DRAFT_523304 [Lenzites betulinus]